MTVSILTSKYRDMTARQNATTARILTAAVELFSEHAYADVSVDRIAERAGITKMTLYQYFRSKDELALESLRMRLERREEKLDQFLSGLDAKANPLLAMFDWLEDWLDPERFHGCSFVKAVHELSAVLPEVKEIALDAKQKVCKRFTMLARRAGRERPTELGQRLALLFEGAQTLALIENSAHAARVAKQTAMVLLQER